MYNHYINFFNSKKKINTNIIALHGHGFDYLFQGMYLPHKRLRIFGKDTYLKLPLDMNNHDDIVKYYFLPRYGIAARIKLGEAVLFSVVDF